MVVSLTGYFNSLILLKFLSWKDSLGREEPYLLLSNNLAISGDWDTKEAVNKRE